MDKKENYRKQIETVKKELDPENLNYFNDLQSYLTFTGWLVDEEELLVQLYSMVSDLKYAQDDQLTAEEYFGNDPKKMADELIKTIPKNSRKERVQLFLSIVGTTWLIKFISDFSGKGQVEINLLGYFFQILISVLFIYFLFMFIRLTIYTKKQVLTNPKVQAALVFIIFFLFLLLSLVNHLFLPVIVGFHVPYPIDIMVILVVIFSVLFYFLAKKSRENYPLAFMLIVFALLGIAKRIATQMSFEGAWFSYASIGFVVVAYGIYLFWSKHSAEK